MAESSGPGRPPTKLSEKLNHHLNMYAFAASAAGVSMLALAQPSEAKIVYTKTHQFIGTNGVYNLDLNHDGTVDFLIQQYGNTISTGGGLHNWLLAKEALGNAVQGIISNGKYYASALKAGARIGPRQRFIKGGPNGEALMSFQEDEDSQQPHTYGQWINVKNRYLGLRFKIKGKTHYGWARLSVHNKLARISATLTGYAYETVPNRSISAGQTQGSAAIAPPNSETVGPVPDALQGTTLGVLALGAQITPSRRQP